MNLALSLKERELLLDVLKNYQSDFSVEIADTSTPDYRTELKAQAEILRHIIEKVEKGPTKASRSN